MKQWKLATKKLLEDNPEAKLKIEDTSTNNTYTNVFLLTTTKGMETRKDGTPLPIVCQYKFDESNPYGFYNFGDDGESRCKYAKLYIEVDVPVKYRITVDIHYLNSEDEFTIHHGSNNYSEEEAYQFFLRRRISPTFDCWYSHIISCFNHFIKEDLPAARKDWYISGADPINISTVIEKIA